MKNQTVFFKNRPSIIGFASVVGKKESEGPLGEGFDEVITDCLDGKDSFEKAESSFQTRALNLAIEKSSLTPKDIDVIFAGDLLNQCIGSAFGIRESEIPFVGLYGACSTMALSLGMAALSTQSGVKYAAALTSSHFCSSERQFRFPLEYGSQRTPTAQWTVTGAGSVILEAGGKKGPFINSMTIGKIMDYKVKDANNMGAAMAPAACDTITAFLKDTKTSPEDYDAIFTGDLGKVGTILLLELLEKNQIDIRNQHKDCGMMIFNFSMQDIHGGGSGCGCAASVLCSHILNGFNNGTYKNVLFCATGALMSTTSSQQGESIPSVAHLIHITAQ